jgi:hypothetical protein
MSDEQAPRALRWRRPIRWKYSGSGQRLDGVDDRYGRYSPFKRQRDKRINIRGVVPRPNYQTVGTIGASGRPATSHASLPPRYQVIWV